MGSVELVWRNVALAMLDEPCQDGQYHDLSQYWKPHLLLDNGIHIKSKANRRRAQVAVSAIKKSATAIAKAANGYFFPAAAPMAFGSSFIKQGTDFRGGPIKKRKREKSSVTLLLSD
mgnify:CR=1 FL=1